MSAVGKILNRFGALRVPINLQHRRENLANLSGTINASSSDADYAAVAPLLDTDNSAAPPAPANPTRSTLPMWAVPRKKLAYRLLLRLRAALYDLTNTINRLNPWRTLTPDEARLREERIQRRRHYDALKKEARAYERLIQGKLDNIGLSYRRERNNRIEVKNVQFSDCLLYDAEIWLRVDNRPWRWPHGVLLANVTRPETLAELTASCGHEVRSEFSKTSGAWLVIERGVGVRGIPNHVLYADVLATMPESADGLSVPLGTGLNSERFYPSLNRMYHLLVAGNPGSGKSNFLHALTLTLLRRNKPERLKMLLIDLKGGVEFTMYAGVPHLVKPAAVPNGIATHREQVIPALEWVHAEGQRRLDVLREANVQNIGQYNKGKRSGLMPHLVVIIDEWADVMFDRKIKGRAEDVLASVASLYRACGIHVVVCTQVPRMDVLTPRIKGVIPARLAFRTPSLAASMVILDNGNSKGLNPDGRCIWQWNDEIEVQTPYIPIELLQSEMPRIVAGNVAELTRKHDVTLDEILRWALDTHKGQLLRDEIWNKYQTRGITRDELSNMLREIDGKTVVVSNTTYQVQKASGAAPRRLIPV